MPSFRKRPARLVSITLLTVASLVLAGCQMTDAPQTTFVAQGDAAREILNLFRPIFWVGMAVFVIVEGLLIWSVIRYRRRPDDGIPLQIHGNTPIEIAWTILPAIIVVGIATLTFRTQSVLVAPPNDPLQVTVVGNQWWWEFRYPQYGITTANELHLPAGRPVQLRLESKDVIHSFWLPRLSGKTDAIPGNVNTMVFTPDQVTQPTFIRGECAEYCGGTHAQMGMWAVVEPPADFEAWATRQQAPAEPPEGITVAAQATAEAGVPVGATVEPNELAEQAATDTGATAVGNDVDAATAATITANLAATATSGDPAASAAGQPTTLEARGYQLFASKGCIGCHALNGYPNAVSQVGPNLTHVGSRRTIVAGWLENTPENMKRWLRNPDEVKPGNVMASAIKLGTLNKEEIDALTAYLESLQ